MPTEYVIVGISQIDLLNLIKSSNINMCIMVDRTKLFLENDYNDKMYTLKKRIEFGKIENIAPDNIDRASDYSTVWMKNDGSNGMTFFLGQSELITNPEIILDKICELAENNNYDVRLISEHDIEFQKLKQ